MKLKFAWRKYVSFQWHWDSYEMLEKCKELYPAVVAAIETIGRNINPRRSE